ATVRVLFARCVSVGFVSSVTSKVIVLRRPLTRSKQESSWKTRCMRRRSSCPLPHRGWCPTSPQLRFSRSTTSAAIRTRNTLPVSPRQRPHGRQLLIGYRKPPMTFRCCTLIRLPLLPPKQKRRHRMSRGAHETCSSPSGLLPSFH